MNWLDRYIEAVRRYLPTKERDDVGEEIRSLLQDRIDEIEAETGAPADEQAVLGIVADYGHPLKVAAAYQDRRVLISEPLFPIYKQVLKFVLLALLALFVLSSMLSASGVLPGGLGIDWFLMILLYPTLVTVIFHVADRQLQGADFFDRWQPRKLPPAHPGVPGIPLSESIAAIPFLLVWFWLLSAISNDYSLDALLWRGESLVPSFMLWLRIQAVLSLVMNVANVFRPWWTPAKLALATVSALIFAAIAFRALWVPDFAGHVVGGGSDGYNAWLDSGLPTSIDLVIRGVLVSLIVVSIGEVITYARKAQKLRMAA